MRLLQALLLCLACSCTFGKAWTKCELGALPQTVQTVEACALGAITSIADWRAELLTCGAGLAPGQLDCLVKAITAWADAGFKAGRFKAGGVHSLISQRGREWLAEHPATSCSNAPWIPPEERGGVAATGRAWGVLVGLLR